MPLLTARFTVAPSGMCLPGFGLCEITRPRLTSFEYLLVIFPGLQRAFVSARLAAASFLPLSFGTMHMSLVNSTVTDRAWLIATWQEPLPEQAPDQREKTEPAAGAATSATLVPYRKLREQIEPQLIPRGFELTLPEPVPDLLTVKVTGRNENVAVTDLAWVMLTMQVSVPEQSPDHPVKPEPVAGVAVSATVVP